MTGGSCGRFQTCRPTVLEEREHGILARIGPDIHPLGRVLKTRMEQAALRRLVERGLVQVAGVTPSDAAHVLGRVDAWDGEAAAKALLLLGRRRTGAGERLAQTAEAMAGIIVDQLTHQTGLALLETSFCGRSA